MKSVKLWTIVVACVLNYSCDLEDDGNGDGGDGPAEARLIYPENNSECTTGTVENDLESTIGFQWDTSANTDYYEVNVKDLESGETLVFESDTNSIDITLERGRPYEWYVVSMSDNVTDMAVSETWKFYNQGPGIVNYAPFPADVVYPERGGSLNTTSLVNLQWEGSDVDNDIDSYEVYLGTEEDEYLTSLGTTSQNSMDAPVISGQTYYWLVITVDERGNSSESEIFYFEVL